jgi:outer membrane protein assembly factor BamB
MRYRFSLWATVVGGLVLADHAVADWPQFRGPDANGLTAEAKLPVEWGAEKNIAWKIAVPGVAWSQPIVLGDKIYITTAETEDQPKPRAGGGGFGGGRGGFGAGGPGGPGRGPRPEGADGPPPGAPPPPGAGDQPPPPPGPDGPPPPDGERRGRGERGERGGRGGPGGGFGGRGAEPPESIYRWKLLCLDAKNGDVIWEKQAKEARPTIPTHSTNTYASETPITDGKHIYAYFGMTGLYCFDLDGNQVWEKDLGTFPMMMGWGTGGSPVLLGDTLYLQCDNEEKSFLVALNKANGDELWKIERDEASNWSTPYVWKNKLRTELVTAGGNKMRSYNPENGEILWEVAAGAGRCSATPVGDDEMLYIGAGGGMRGSGPLLAIKAGATGDISLGEGETSNEGVAWVADRGGPPMASPLLYNGLLYVLDQRGGLVRCYDAKTGQEHYRERLPDGGGFTSSPWASDGKVFCLDDKGQTFVLEAGPTLKVLGVNKLDEMFWSSAAVVGDKLLLRGVDHLYCITN